MLAPVRTIAPSVLPISLVEAKRNCRVDHSDDDALITSLIEAATSHMDGYSGVTGRALLAQTWYQEFPCFADPVRLPVGPAISVTEVSYSDTNNVDQIFPLNNIRLKHDALGPYIHVHDYVEWPSTFWRKGGDAVSITWVAGFGTTPPDVPPPFRQAIELLVAHWYANREAVNVENITSNLPFTVRALIDPLSRRQR